MQRQEIRSLADLAGEGTRVLTTLVRDMHAGIASRVFAAVGPPSRPTQIIHDGIALAVYASNSELAQLQVPAKILPVPTDVSPEMQKIVAAVVLALAPVRSVQPIVRNLNLEHWSSLALQFLT